MKLHKKAAIKQRKYIEFQPLLDKYDFTQVGFAIFTRTDANTVNNWARGRTRIPALVWLFFDLLEARPELREVVREVTS